MPKKGFWRELLQAAGEGTRQGVSAYARSGGKASAGLSEVLNRGTQPPRNDARYRRMGDAAIQAYREAQSRWNKDDDGNERRGRRIQYTDRDVKVTVTNGYSRREREYTTDIVVIHRDPSIKQHLHVVFGEDGHEIENRWRDNH